MMIKAKAPEFSGAFLFLCGREMCLRLQRAIPKPFGLALEVSISRGQSGKLFEGGADSFETGLVLVGYVE